MILAETPEGLRLRQNPVEEFRKARVSVSVSQGEGKVFYMMQKAGVVEITVHMQSPCDFVVNLYGTSVTYIPSCGKMNVGKETVQLGKELNDFLLLRMGKLWRLPRTTGLSMPYLRWNRTVNQGM